MADPDDELRNALVPYLGERAVTMFAFSVADGIPCPEVAGRYRRELEDSGDDPLDPQVTEAERLLLDWGRLRGAGSGTAKPELDARVAATFQPRLRELLAQYADDVVARCRPAAH